MKEIKIPNAQNTMTEQVSFKTAKITSVRQYCHCLYLSCNELITCNNIKVFLFTSPKNNFFSGFNDNNILKIFLLPYKAPFMISSVIG